LFYIIISLHKEEPAIQSSDDRIHHAALAVEIERAERLVAAAEKSVRIIATQLRRAQRRSATLESKPAAATARGRAAARQRLREAKANLKETERQHRLAVRRLAAQQKQLASLQRQARRLDRALGRFHTSFAAAEPPPPLLDGGQIRAARALLQWSQSELAKRAKVSVSTIRGIERQRALTALDAAVLERLVKAIDNAGVELIGEGFYVGMGGPGVRLRRRGTRVGGRRKPAAASAGAKKRIKAVA
jgi:DNA-binding transcriptional regulator YiaG